ncbi:MAG: hypothetical protein L3J39_07450 [Verrucomicrobiales bacterium]|nr:hypothetical protein [Verrucomicrobiales bacterium]
MKISLITLSLIHCLASPFAQGAESKIGKEQLIEQVFSQAKQYFKHFQHPKTGVLYGSRLSSKKSWTSPADVLAEKPKPWGYGSRIADTGLHTGHILAALLDAYEARPDPFLKKEIRKCFEALKMIGSLPEQHPKPNKPAQIGLVPRGPHPDDMNAWFDDSSMDQHTTYIISLALFSKSELASEADKTWIKQSLGKVGRRLEGNDWSIKRADGVTESHVGFSWRGYNSNHVSILLPAVLALYEGTQDEHWLKQYEFFLNEAKEKRWQAVHPGPHIKINGHPIYANQNAFRVNAWYQFEKDPDRKSVIAALLRQSTQMQLARDFPGEMYRKFHSEDEWQRVRRSFNWGDAELHGAASAWQKFQPEMLAGQDGGMAALAHVRFPLGGYHMVLQSEQEDLIRENIPAIWKMLTTVHLQEISAAETHYLFTVVGLHLYALYFRHPEFFSSNQQAERALPEKLSILANANIGKTKNVTAVGTICYAIGSGALRTIDVSTPSKPKLLGKLEGLGAVRQITVRADIAYITSRQDGLFIVDVKNPKQPVLLNHYDTVEFATGVALSGDVLFVACRNYGVELIDVSDPSRPVHLSLVRTGEAQSVVVRKGFLYVGVWATSELVVVDVRQARTPKITAKLELDGYGDGVDVAGNYVYVATGHHSRATPRKNPGDPGFGKGHGLEVFNLNDPAHPQWVSRIKFPPLYEIGNDMWEVTMANGHAFVADTWNGVFVVDVENPSQMKIVAQHEPPAKDGNKNFIGGLALIKDHILIAGGYSDLHILAAPGLAASPVDEPDQAPVIGKPAAAKDTQREGWQLYQTQGQVYAVDFLSDDRAVVACGSAGVHLLKLWPEIERLQVLKTQGFATDVSVVNDQIFVAESSGGLSIWKNSKGGAFKKTGSFHLTGKAIRQVEVPASTDRVMIQAGANQFYVLDTSNAQKPKVIFEDKRHGLLYGDQMMRGLVEDRYAAVFWHVTGTYWYDLLAQPKPIYSGDNFPQRTGSSNGSIAMGKQTLITLRGGYILVDRSERRPLKDLTLYPIGKSRANPGVPSLAKNLLYTANRSTGLITITDISDPHQPQLIEQFVTPGTPTRIGIRHGLAVIPDGYHGLMVQVKR